MKTLEEWNESGLNLEDYLGGIPVEIDEELYYYCYKDTHTTFGHDINNTIFQWGDICDTDNDNVDYYHTLAMIENKYFSLGELPDMTL